MADREHFELFERSTQKWNRWRKEHPEIRPDLSNVNLRGTNLRDANLIHADLHRANLGHADLSHVDLGGANLSDADLTGAYLVDASLVSTYLSRADLSGADLSRANLSRADFSGANLSRARLSGACLVDANLSRARLSGANFSGVYLRDTIFAGNDLSTVRGLANIDHRGRSYISLDTVKLPQDGSALHFLRGAGVPNEWIDDYRAHMMKPIQYYSCFISYSSSDEVLAKRLHADLQDEGVRCWFAPHDLRPGQLFRKGIDEAIHMQDKLLLILSESSVESGWVGYEVETALHREIRQKREILFPIRIDDTVFRNTASWAREIQEKRHIGDFRQWTDPKHYQQVFKRLLHDLKTQTD